LAHKVGYSNLGVTNTIVTKDTNYSALLAAVNRKSPTLVRMLIAAGASAGASIIPAASRIRLQLTADNGVMDIVHILLDTGADVNSPPYTRYGATALEFAAIRGYAGIAQPPLG
jgi:ankyrin repeat protein